MSVWVLSMGVLLFTATVAAQSPTKEDTVAWLNERVREKSDPAEESVRRESRMKWEGCSVTIDEASKIRDASLGINWTTTRITTVRLADVRRVVRSDEKDLIVYMLHAKTGVTWPYSGVDHKGQAYSATREKVPVLGDVFLGERAEKAITHLATLCGATLDKEVF